MDTLATRQVAILRQTIEKYQKGGISLDSFIQRIESLLTLVDNDKHKQATVDIIIELEQINAAIINGRTWPSESEKSVIASLINSICHQATYFK